MAADRERLNRYLARRGVSSRRGADTLIGVGRVTVNGATATIGTSVDPHLDQISVDGAPIPNATRPATLMLNKPVGVVTTVHDPQGRPTVMDLVTAIPGLVPVGRLDADSRGLLLLSSDGELVHRLTHPRHGVTKRYRLVLDRDVAPDHLRRLVAGVQLEDGPARALAARRGGTAAANVIEVTMGEGRKREVRRLCAALDLRVTDLVRVAFGPIKLGQLRPARARPLTAGEERDLYGCVGLVVP